MTYQPHLYDAVVPATLQGDVEWYSRKARESGGPVLELGAGAGRVTLAIAAAGVSIHALDADEGMLRVLEQKLQASLPEVRQRVHPVLGDMRSFELPERFALIISPFRAFLHNVTDGDRLACLDRVRVHLKPGGHFAFNVFHPSLEVMMRGLGAYGLGLGSWEVLGS